MAKLNFRQGIVRYPSVSEGGPFLAVSGNKVNITSGVLTSPAQVAFAHLNQNYLFDESNANTSAWGSGPNPNVGSLGPNNNAPFTTLNSFYLYWDIDFVTGITSYDYTLLAPVVSATAPSNPSADQHWYDTTNFVMKVRVGSLWVEKVRVFAATYTGGGSSGLTIRPLGTQISVQNVTAYAGYVLFDDDNKPLQRFRRDRKGVFIHTEMPLASQYNAGGGVANFRLDTRLFYSAAIEPIPAYAAVAYFNPTKLCLARNTVPTKPAVGIAAEDMTTGDYKSFIPSGYVENIAWNWDVFGTTPPGTPLFVSATGELTTTVPQTNSVQQMGFIVDAVTIYVQPQQVITYG